MQSKTPPNAASANVGSTIAIRIIGNVADVEPPFPEMPLELLAYRTLSFVRGEARRPVRARRQLYTHDVRGRLVVPAGMVPRIAACARAHGYEVTITDHRRDLLRCQGMNGDLAKELAPDEVQLLSAVQSARTGQIAVRSDAARIRAIEIICRQFNEAHIFVPAATIREVRWLRDHLEPSLRGHLGTATGSSWQLAGRVGVCTYKPLSTAFPEDVDIVLVPFAEQAIGDRSPLTRYPHQRLYAFVDADARHSQRTALRLEAMFGPVIYRSVLRGDETVDVRVLVASSPLVPMRLPLTALERKRQQCWKNGPRNDAIAKVAAAFADRHIAQLWQHGLLLNEHSMPPLPKDSRVAVLVESAEHGQELARRLPDWPLLHQAADPQPGLASPTSPEALYRLPARSIMTTSRAHTFGNLPVDVLVVASGGDAIPALKGFPARRAGPLATETLLVEFADDYDQRAQEDLQGRLTWYRSRQWRVEAPTQWGAQRRVEPDRPRNDSRTESTPQ